MYVTRFWIPLLLNKTFAVMKTFKKILIGFIIFIALFCIIGLFLPGKSHIERSTQINAPVDTVFNLVGNLKNWEKWSPWHKMDPEMKITYTGPESGTGAAYAWDSGKWSVGSGKLTIGEYIPNQKIETLMNFMEDESTTKGGFLFTPADNGTQITWYVDIDGKEQGGIHNVTGGWMKLMMDGMMKKHFDDGLANLKAEAE